MKFGYQSVIEHHNSCLEHVKTKPSESIAPTNCYRALRIGLENIEFA